MAIAEHVSELIPDGATLQTGFGAIPSAVVSVLAEGNGGDYGIHSEMFTTGLMDLHQAGKVTNQKGQFDGVSVTTFAGGSPELYEWLDGNHDVAFLPVDVVNSPLTIRPQPLDGHDQRCDRRRRPRPGGRRHVARAPVLGHRRPRGLRVRSGPVARRPVDHLHAVVGDGGGRAPVADPPVVPGGHGDHHAPPSGRHRSSPSSAWRRSTTRRSTSEARRSPRWPTRTSATRSSRPPSERPTPSSPLPPL